jgi:hypothetical protein
MKLYVTYGFGSNLANCYSVVEANTEEACRQKVRNVCGGKYAFTYSEKNFEGQVEAYNLKEVELQPQRKL